MAAASKDVESFKYLETRNSDRSIDDTADDFEVVSDINVDPLSIVSEYGSRGGHDGPERTIGNDDIHVIDPLSAFEMIHSEHRLLKDELESQNDMLRQRLESMELQEHQKAEEISALKSDVEVLSMELEEKKTQVSEMERQIKYFRESSEKSDLLTAKLMEAEDVMKSQHEMIQQLRSDGYSGAPTSPVLVPSTDDNLRAELALKDEQIKRMEGNLALLESSLATMNGEFLKMKQEAKQLAEMNRELQGIVAALQSQEESDKSKTEMDKAEWEVIRADLEQQIQVLSDRVLAFENQYSGASMNQPQNANAASGTPFPRQEFPGSDSPILRHRGTPTQDRNQYDDVRWIECDRCRLPMPAMGPHPCPSIIDGLD